MEVSAAAQGVTLMEGHAAALRQLGSHVLMESVIVTLKVVALISWRGHYNALGQYLIVQVEQGHASRVAAPVHNVMKIMHMAAGTGLEIVWGHMAAHIQGAE